MSASCPAPQPTSSTTLSRINSAPALNAARHAACSTAQHSTAGRGSVSVLHPYRTRPGSIAACIQKCRRCCCICMLRAWAPPLPSALCPLAHLQRRVCEQGLMRRRIVPVPEAAAGTAGAASNPARGAAGPAGRARQQLQGSRFSGVLHACMHADAGPERGGMPPEGSLIHGQRRHAMVEACDCAARPAAARILFAGAVAAPWCQVQGAPGLGSRALVARIQPCRATEGAVHCTALQAGTGNHARTQCRQARLTWFLASSSAFLMAALSRRSSHFVQLTPSSWSKRNLRGLTGCNESRVCENNDIPVRAVWRRGAF